MLLSILLNALDVMVVVSCEVTVVLESETLGDVGGELVSALMELLEYRVELDELLDNDVEVVEDAEGVRGLFDTVVWSPRLVEDS